jgi:hypothetical protein
MNEEKSDHSVDGSITPGIYIEYRHKHQPDLQAGRIVRGTGLKRNGLSHLIVIEQRYRGVTTMLRKLTAIFAFAFLAFGLVAPSALAAVSFDAASGTGFVGKGDVQLVLGLNNAQLQAQADGLQFASVSTVVTEVSWICTNDRNENIQERARTTTTSITGVVDSVARVKNQITGFNLTGYNGTPTQSSSTEGNPLNSCPSGPWGLTTPAGDPVVISSSTVLTVNGVPLQ